MKYSSPIPIFIINLPQSTERKKFIIDQFDNLEIPLDYRFFNAIHGKENPDFYLFKKYNEQKYFQRKGKKLSLSQLGCWASHYLLWEKCVELNQSFIILEDDAIIKSNFLDAYQFISSKNNDFEFLWLSIPSPDKRKQGYKIIHRISNSKNSVARFYKSWANTTGYYLTPNAAKKLLNHSQEWVYEVDTQIERYWETQIPYLAIVPFCIEPDLSKESNISTIKTKKSFIIKLKREWYRLKDLVNRFLFNLKHRG
ncbi:TPA: glycosyltransferase family 25 protein [Pasteurella multocida]|uniref:GatK n=1 Tax=Pasteurella multocida subsp. multocida TaxID=44283 RepID=A0A097IYM6_PASMD|nr:glycosyltransferase family 25 protein [Pasteurella multocida]AIT72039.1 GatK [Pasteurella multocida subsp. multocida]MCL7798500.1 glycosyltransferase family 25 protein [Pasteurella multocida]MDO5072142.1 glycosyltransferase family 25 protein [Pasteurella multocida]URH96343.1 glycosyltransferase family 25 protein [Pasteurella multocida]HDR0673861.1 glycosyltransferase family 25 protein [Pasteurella multocida]